MTKKELLIKHYSEAHLRKIFLSKLELSSGSPGVMFFYDKSYELENFKSSFGIYLPLYAENEDFIESMDVTEDIDEKLSIYSRRIWKNSTVIPHRETKVNGIYGELFLDIYLRIVQGRKLLISYSSKRSFKTNVETTGIDSIGYIFNGGNIELFLSEAKFVLDKNSAQRQLMNDISKEGAKSHLTEEFLNDYIGFVLKKDISCSENDREKIKLIFEDINKEVNALNNPKSFLQVLKEKNIKIHFVCFAIFQDEANHPDDIDSIYSELINEIESQFLKLEITNKSSEIVFIPTQNKSMIIKEAIDSFYD